MWTIIAAVATCSVGLHILLLHAYSVKKLWECIRYGDWFEAILPFGSMGGCLLADYIALKQIVPKAASDGLAGAMKAIINLGTQAISLFNKFLADLMANIIFIGFIPGGKSGLIIGVTLSVALNVIYFWLFSDWIKEIISSRSSKKRIA